MYFAPHYNPNKESQSFRSIAHNSLLQGKATTLEHLKASWERISNLSSLKSPTQSILAHTSKDIGIQGIKEQFK